MLRVWILSVAVCCSKSSEKHNQLFHKMTLCAYFFLSLLLLSLFRYFVCSTKVKWCSTIADVGIQPFFLNTIRQLNVVWKSSVCIYYLFLLVCFYLIPFVFFVVVSYIPWAFRVFVFSLFLYVVVVFFKHSSLSPLRFFSRCLDTLTTRSQQHCAQLCG